MIVTDERVARFIGERLGFGVFPPYTCMGIEKDGEIIGGALFNCFEGNDVHVSIAGSGFDRSFIKAVGEYVFDQLGYGRITSITEKKSIVKLGERLGGKLEGCLRNHFGKGRDGYIVGILEEEFKYR